VAPLIDCDTIVIDRLKVCLEIIGFWNRRISGHRHVVPLGNTFHRPSTLPATLTERAVLMVGGLTLRQSHATWMIINSLLQRLCRRDMAAIVLKAFPLEYEGNATKENRAAFERRQRALVRLYRSRLGFKPASDSSLAREGFRRLNTFNARSDKSPQNPPLNANGFSRLSEWCRVAGARP
jgi:hypothetical protein